MTSAAALAPQPEPGRRAPRRATKPVGVRARGGARGAAPSPGTTPSAICPRWRASWCGEPRVLRKRGFAALTLEAVGREAGEPRSSITYYFGDKRGLVAASGRGRSSPAAQAGHAPDRRGRRGTCLPGAGRVRRARAAHRSGQLPHVLRPAARAHSADGVAGRAAGRARPLAGRAHGGRAADQREPASRPRRRTALGHADRGRGRPGHADGSRTRPASTRCPVHHPRAARRPSRAARLLGQLGG